MVSCVMFVHTLLPFLTVALHRSGTRKTIVWSMTVYSKYLSSQCNFTDQIGDMVFNTLFNNISVISWRSVLLVEESGVPGENHWLVASHWQIYLIMLYGVHLSWTGFELTTLVAIGTDCIGSCKSNYHTITTTTMMAPTDQIALVQDILRYTTYLHYI